GELDVALVDSTFDLPEEGFRAALERHRPRLVVLCEDNFNFLTKMCLTRNRELAFFMCQEARRAGLPVAVNSSDASDHVSEYLAHGADFVLLGEVEIALRDLARRLLWGSPATGPNHEGGARRRGATTQGGIVGRPPWAAAGPLAGLAQIAGTQRDEPGA